MKEQKTIKIKWDTLRDKAHEMAAKHGFWDVKVSQAHCLCLVISELMEAVEADRKNIRTAPGVIEALDADDPDYSHKFKDSVKDTLEDELADTLIRLLDLAGGYNVSLKDLDKYEVYLDERLSFTENVFMTVGKITGTYSMMPLEETVNVGFAYVLRLADLVGCNNILLHMACKMRYNAGREKLHGKRY